MRNQACQMDSSISASASMDQYQNSNFDNDYDEIIPSKAKLLDTITHLQSENQQLQEQFEQALSISKTIEETHRKNALLTTEIRQITLEKEDIQRRLLISMQTINELNDKINKLKQIQQNQLEIDQDKISKEIETIKSNELEKQQKLKTDYDQLQKEFEEKSIACQLLANKIDRAIQNGERYFHVTLSDFDMLISILSQPQPIIHSQESKSAAPSPGTDFNKQNSNRVLKNSLKKMATKFKILEQEKTDEIDELKRTIINMKRENNNEKEKYEAIISNLNEEKQRFESQTKLKIESLEKTVESLKNERQSMKETAFGNNDEKDIFNIQKIESEHRLQMQKQQTQMKARMDELEEQFGYKIHELTEKLERAEHDKEEYCKQLSQKEKVRQQLELDFERIKGELSSLRIIHNESQNEIDSLRMALHSTADENLKNNNSPPRSNEKTPREYLLKLNKEIERQKMEIEQLKDEKEKEIAEKNQYQKTIKKLENELNESTNKLMKTEESFDQYCIEVQRQPKPTADDLLPPSTFLCNEIISNNPTLHSMVERIANNSSLQPASKIKNILKSVMNYYEQQLDSVRAILQSESDKNDLVKQNFNKFLIDSSLIILEVPFTFDDFSNPEKNVMYIKKLSEMKEQLDLLSHRCSSYQLVFEHFDDLIKEAKFKPISTNENTADFDQMINHVEQFRLAWQEQTTNSKSLSKKMKHLIKEYMALKNEKERQIKDYEFNLEQATIQIDESEKKIVEQEKLIKKLKQDSISFTREIEQLRIAKDEIETELKLMNEDAVSIISNRMKEKDEKLKQLTTELNQKLNESENEKSEIENKLNVCQKLLQMERNSVQKLDVELRDIQKEMQEKEQRSQIRLKEEKKQLAESYERTFDQLRKQCETYRNDVQKISHALSESDEVNKQLKFQIMTFQNEKNQYIELIKSNDENNIRQKRLYETSLKAKLMAVDTEYNKKLEELQVQNEVETRKIFSFFADSFRTYFNPAIQINEKSFRIIVDQVRQELERLSRNDSAIRKMLSISENQPIEDAIAQIFLDKNS